MKKFLNFMLSLVLIISMFSFLGSNASAEGNTESIIQINKNDLGYTFEEIMTLEKYVSVNEEGLFILDTTSAVKDGVRLGLLTGQQKYFDSLNLEIKKGKLKANKNLEITNLGLDPYFKSDEISIYSNCNGVTRGAKNYWWGKKSYFNSCDANRLGADLNSIAIGFATTGLLNSYFPGAFVGAGLTAGYYQLFSSRVYANNSHNTGIIVDLTWALVFDITPQ